MQIVRALYTKKPLVTDVNINFRGSQIDMAEQCLNVTDIGTVFIQMTGEAVATGMRGYFPRNSNFFRTGFEELVHA